MSKDAVEIYRKKINLILDFCRICLSFRATSHIRSSNAYTGGGTPPARQNQRRVLANHDRSFWVHLQLPPTEIGVCGR